MTIFAKLALTGLVFAVALGLLVWGMLQLGPTIDEDKRERWVTATAVVAVVAIAAASIAVTCGASAMLEVIWSS